MEAASINVGGMISVAVFYAVILAVGMYFGWKQKKLYEMRPQRQHSETIILAGRDLGLFVGVLTMTGKFDS